MADADWRIIRGTEGTGERLAQAVTSAVKAVLKERANAVAAALRRGGDESGATERARAHGTAAGAGGAPPPSRNMAIGTTWQDIRDIGLLTKSMLLRTLPNALAEEHWERADDLTDAAKDFVNKLIACCEECTVAKCFGHEWLRGHAEPPADAWTVPPRITAYKSGQFGSLKNQLAAAREGSCIKGVRELLRLGDPESVKTAKWLLGQLDTPSVETLRAPPIAPIDREANPPEIGNRRLTELNADGIIYIRGVKYTLLPDGCVVLCLLERTPLSLLCARGMLYMFLR